MVLMFYMNLNTSHPQILTSLINGVALYIDPTYIYFIIPVAIVSNYVRNRSINVIGLLSSMTLSISIFGGLMLLAGDYKSDLRNYFNIIAVVDHSENIGLYWYIMIEVFHQHIEFYQFLFLVFIGIISVQNILLLSH